MTALEIARIYVEVVQCHDAIPDDEAAAKDLVACLRSNLHYALMDTLRAQGIEFGSRGEAAAIAFKMVEGQDGSKRTAQQVAISANAGIYPGA